MTTECVQGSDLPSCKIYELLSTQNGDPDNFIDDCENLVGRIQYSGILELCKKLGDNLINFCSNEEKQNPLNGNCEFLHYWLFYEIINKLNLTDNGEIEGAISRFQHTWKNIMEKSLFKKKYEPNVVLFNKLSPHDLMFRKDMYDYIYNYDNFDKITFDSTQTDNEYCKYLPSMLAKYDQFKNDCPQRSDKCLYDAKSFEKYNPEKLCEKLQCRKEHLCKTYFERTPAQRESDGDGSLEGVKRADPRDDEAVTPGEESETSTILTTVGPSFLGLFITSFILFKVK